MEIERGTSALQPPYDRPIVGEDWKKLFKVASASMAAAFAFMSIIFVLAYNNILKLYPSDMYAAELGTYMDRVQYAIRYQTLLILWLIINVHLVMYVRLTKKAVNPLTASTEHHCQAVKAVLTNSCEQILISLFAQLMVISYASPMTVLTMIPAINVVQFIGRVAFYFGYPIYRSFGMMLTLLPNTIMIFYGLFKFGDFINLY